MPSFLSRLFGKSEPAVKPAEPVHHSGCRIYPAPMKEASGYRVAARIEKDFGAETRVHQLVRADTHTSLDDATEASLGKAKLAIDQLGDELFR